jgi:hypothetical protein
MSQRLAWLQRLQEVPLRPEEAQALMQRVKTHTTSAQDCARCAQVIGATLEVSPQLLDVSPRPASRLSGRPSPERTAQRKRQAVKASRRRNRGSAARWPPGQGLFSRERQEESGSVMPKPPSRLELRAQDGDVLIARVHPSGLSREAAGLVAQSIRLSCGVACALQEAQRRVKRLRAVVCGQGPRVARPPEVEVAPTASAPRAAGAGASEFRPVDEPFCGLEGATAVTQPGGGRRASPSTPTGGQRPGPGRLGAAP